MNDGGHLVKDREQRRDIYLDFIKRADSNCTTNETIQDGVYSSFEIGEHPTKIKFILLDTRFNRHSHWIRSIGEYKFPLSALLAAFLRGSYTTLGYGADHDGDILGELQWNWLQGILESSTADFHVIASSIQIFTTNPVLESWGHFPHAKKRLVNMLKHYDPSGLLFLSGDVHFSEIATIDIHRHGNTDMNDTHDTVDRWYEVTSSGMTHLCDDSIITRHVCPSMISLFSAHRYPRTYNAALSTPLDTDSQQDKPSEPTFLLQRNFGIITSYNANDCNSSSYLEVCIVSLENSLELERNISDCALRRRVYSRSTSREKWNAHTSTSSFPTSNVMDIDVTGATIVKVDYPSFHIIRINPEKILCLFLLATTFIFIFLQVFRKKLYR